MLGHGKRRCRRAGETRFLVLRQADSVVERAQPGAPGDRVQPCQLRRVHELAAFVAAGDERELLVEGGLFARQDCSRRCAIPAIGDALPERDLAVALDDLEPHAHLVNAVVNRLQLGRLVDDVFGRGHLAAVVQPARDLHCFPLLIAEVEIAVRPFLRVAGRAREHQRQLGDARAMAAGVGRLGVDRAGEEADQRVEERLAGLEQALRFDCHGGRA